MSDEEIARLHRRIDGIVEAIKDHDTKNAKRFDKLDRAILGDSRDLEQPGILRRILLLETYTARMTRNAQLAWGFLVVLTGSIGSWILTKIGAKP